MDYEKLGNNIRNYRELRGFTQEKLAELSNISDKHLSKIERGKINIKIDTLVNIDAALSVSVDKLLSEMTGINVMIADDAISCVALGTGKALDNLDELDKGVAPFTRRRRR